MALFTSIGFSQFWFTALAEEQSLTKNQLGRWVD